MTVTRREMLKLMTASGAVLAAPPIVRQALAEPRVLAFRGESAATVRKVIDSLGGMSRFVSRGDRVVIKPNMGFAQPDARATNTSLVVLRTVIQMALEAGAKNIQVLDNPVHPGVMCALRNGIREGLKDFGNVHVELLSDAKFFAEVAIPRGVQLKKCKVMRPILECDSLINLPTAKSHGGAMVSFSLKNWMGAVHNRGEWHNSLELHQAIADFATFIKPKLSLLDATRALITNGPGGPGEIKYLQTVIGGTDMVAIDSFAVTLSPWNGRKLAATDVPHIRKAAELGVGSMQIAGLAVRTA